MPVCEASASYRMRDFPGPTTEASNGQYTPNKPGQFGELVPDLALRYLQPRRQCRAVRPRLNPRVDHRASLFS